MKITIEPETDEEKADPQVQRVVYAGMAAIAMVAIPGEHPEQTAIYVRSPDPMANTVPLLQQRATELNHQLTKMRFIADSQQAQAQPRIQVPRGTMPNIPFPGNNRMRGK